MNTTREKLLLFIVTAALAAASIPTRAQEKKTERPNREANQGFAGGGMRGAPLGRLMEILSDEQRASLQEAMADQREKTRELEEKRRDLRREIFEASTLEKFDETKVRKAAEELGKADAELTVLRAKAFSKMRPPLSADQIQKLRDQVAGAGNGVPSQDASPRRRADIPRDENGLPLKQK
ncbi:MAG TPA: periplasmic heavy metal sensor [Candidatus Dormibacteraeota bacterium]|nr:periplasmic heavy metal sensor [Candidatus Dormibacteraeota bacterium]